MPDPTVGFPSLPPEAGNALTSLLTVLGAGGVGAWLVKVYNGGAERRKIAAEEMKAIAEMHVAESMLENSMAELRNKDMAYTAALMRRLDQRATDATGAANAATATAELVTRAVGDFMVAFIEVLSEIPDGPRARLREAANKLRTAIPGLPSIPGDEE